MAKEVLTISARAQEPPDKNSVVVVRKGKRGRGRIVKVEKATIKRTATAPVAPSESKPAQKPPEQKRKLKSKGGNIERQKRELQQSARIRRTVQALDRLRRLGPRARHEQSQEKVRDRQSARELAKQENLKDYVARLVGSLMGGSVADFPSLSKAGELIVWLGEIKIDKWAARDQRRVIFAREVLLALISGKTPATIEKPDGGFFRWPTTDVDGGGGGSRMSAPSVDVGVLSALGYRVGEKGVGLYERRALLVKAYERDLNLKLSPEYLREWGQRRTSQRLQKLANAIAAFTRNMKRRRPEASAIEDWESDLEFLKQTYYLGYYSFTWPRCD